MRKPSPPSTRRTGASMGVVIKSLHCNCRSDLPARNSDKKLKIRDWKPATTLTAQWQRDMLRSVGIAEYSSYGVVTVPIGAAYSYYCAALKYARTCPKWGRQQHLLGL